MRLRGLSVTDRGWLLDKLDAPQRRAVESAESELRNILGEQKLDFGLFLDSEHRQVGSDSGSAGHLINGLEFEEVSAVLDRIPATWIKALLLAKVWHQGGKYAERLSARQRRKLAECDTSPVPRRVAMTLADAIVDLITHKDASHG
jgi:hypothetical protein